MHRDRSAARRGSSRRWVAEVGNPSVRHRGGVPWHRCRMPARWHFCTPQSVELREVRTLDGRRWVRDAQCWCACGAMTDPEGRWQGRNGRRRARKQGRDPVDSGGEDAARIGRRRAAATSPRPHLRRVAAVCLPPKSVTADLLLLAALPSPAAQRFDGCHRPEGT